VRVGQPDTVGYIPGTLAQGPDSLLDLRVSDYEEAPSLHASTARRTDARFEDLTDQFVRHRSGFSRRIDRVVRMISKRSVVLGVSSDIAYPFFV